MYSPNQMFVQQINIVQYTATLSPRTAHALMKRVGAQLCSLYPRKGGLAFCLGRQASLEYSGRNIVSSADSYIFGGGEIEKLWEFRSTTDRKSTKF